MSLEASEGMEENGQIFRARRVPNVAVQSLVPKMNMVAMYSHGANLLLSEDDAGVFRDPESIATIAEAVR